MVSKIVAVCVSRRKGTRKNNVNRAYLKKDLGIKGDAHSGLWHRQISLLATESIDKISGLKSKLGPGDFAENLTTQGIILHRLPIGTRLHVGEEAILEVTQIGKDCHSGCAIFQQIGKCIMPKEGIFTKVIHGGFVKAGDRIRTVNDGE